jgi:PAP_fibrillin
VASISDPVTAKLLDGTWYLQYTSPSIVGDIDQFPDSWKPDYTDEGESKIESQRFEAQGSVSAAGITVDTSNKVVKQIFDISQCQVRNEINFDWGQVVVAGTFRQSSRIPNRAVVAFDTALIRLGGSDDSVLTTVNLGFVFAVLAVVRGSRDNGWLETTFLDEDMRIGRGNKGTMFVLTRDPAAVQP